MKPQQNAEINSTYRSILRIAIPTILTSLSTSLMYFVDRAILAGYSTEAMYAATVSGNFVSVFSWIFVGVASTAEIFVGQYNGKNQYDKLAVPIWQMIYMALMSAVIFLPMGYFSEYMNFLPDYARKEGIDYQRALFYSAFLPSLIAALSAFFIGQGKTYVVTIVAVICNVLNGVLAYWFVHGLHEGAGGAAKATIISALFQTIILIAMFLSKRNRQDYKTLKNCAFNKKMFYECFKIGAPLSFGHFFSILAWYLIIIIIGHSSKKLGIVYGIGVTIYGLISFFSEGLNKAIATMTSNMIGRKDIESVKKIYKRFILLLIGFIVLLSIPMVFYQNLSFSTLNLMQDNNIVDLHADLSIVLMFSIGIFLFEALEYITWGILLAGGDSKYPIIVSQICLWTILVIPTTILCYNNKLSSISTIYLLMVLCFIISFLLVYRRYKSLKWFKELV
ncbi:MAG: MATE family efflux transporter [Holosporales bacterium]|jgi:MATE family multidrug resistance protein|nr:MATE family efflux transporter [Holosporales bacterium]